MKKHLLHILIAVILTVILATTALAVPPDPLEGTTAIPDIPVSDPDIPTTDPVISTSTNPYFVGTLKTSTSCIEMLKEMEGYLKKPAGDYGQFSIGYGCNTKYLKQHLTELDLSEEDYNCIISGSYPNYILKEEKAEALMMYVLVEVETKLDAFLQKHNITVNQYQYDSLISFTYNLGYAWMTADSRLGEVLIANNYTVNEFASAMGVYCHVTVNNEAKVLDLLVERRIREIKLFLYGAYNLNDVDVKFCTLRYDAGDGDAFTDIGFYQVGQPYQILFNAEPTADTMPYFVGWYTEAGEKVTCYSVPEKSASVVAVYSATPADPELQQNGDAYHPTDNPSVGETEYEQEVTTPVVDITTVFSDMHYEDWHFPYVSDLYNKGVINGYVDGTFRPGNIVTTGEALKMIILAAGYETPEPVASHWARNFLNLALEEGIIDRGDITDLDIPISRSMMAKVVCRSLKLTPKYEAQFFTDTSNEYAQMLYEYGISNGCGDGTFRPTRSLTRAELAAIVYRMNQQ